VATGPTLSNPFLRRTTPDLSWNNKPVDQLCFFAGRKYRIALALPILPVSIQLGLMATHTDPILSQMEPYQLPSLLQDIRLLDLLELSGTTVQAGQMLNISQPTVSRRYRLLAQDFGLEGDPRQDTHCRYGCTEVIRWLRMGCRAHRMAAGYARIGTDLMHQSLLEGMNWLLPTPVRFRSIESWAALIREGVIDAALVSGMEIRSATRTTRPDLAGMQWREVIEVTLSLGLPRQSVLLNRGGKTPVLVPPRSIAPQLHRTLREVGYELRTAREGCRSERQWKARLNTAGLAVPLYAELPRTGSWAEELEVVGIPLAIKVSLGLLMPHAGYVEEPVERTLKLIKKRQRLIQLHGSAEQTKIDRSNSGYSGPSSIWTICSESQAATQGCRRV
jgi:hypothetical protein